MKKYRNFIFVELFFMSLFAAAVSPFGKIALEAFGPFTVVTIRFMIGLLVFIPFVRLSVEQKAIIRKHWRQLLMVAVSGALIPILFFIGLRFTTATIATFLYTLVPVLTALHVFFFQKKSLSTKTWLGIVMGVVGVGLIILLPLFSQIQDVRLLGNLFGLGAAIAATYFGLWSKRYQLECQFSTRSIMLAFIVVTAFLAMPLAFVETFATNSTLGLASVEARHWISLIIMGVLGTTISYQMYQDILKKSDELIGSLTTFIQPILVPIMAIILLDEQITLELIIGGSLAMIGAWLVSRRKASDK